MRQTSAQFDGWLKCPGCEAPVQVDARVYCDECGRCLVCGQARSQ